MDEIQHLKRANLAKELGLPVSTLGMLIYKCKIIQENHRESGLSASKKLRVQSRKFFDVEKVVNQYRSSRILISGPLLMENTTINFEDEYRMQCIIFLTSLN